MRIDCRIKHLKDAGSNVAPGPGASVYLALAVALLLGLGVRQWAYLHTDAIRFELNQKNSFYWGDRIVHGENAAPGAVGWGSFWRSYVAAYESNESHPAPRINPLDYVPLRLLMAGVWVNYLNMAYGPVLQWHPEFARSFAAFSMVMELAGAAAMFALVAYWIKRTGMGTGMGSLRGIAPSPWGRWEQATAAATLMWLNPASIIDSHVWPHGQTWILPFYLAAVLAILQGRYFLTGAIFGIGAMFKGQMLLVSPLLILWPLFDGRWVGAIRVVLGMASGVGTIIWPWISRGSMAWARAGFGANGMYSDVLRKGESLNLPAVLARVWHMNLHQQVVDMHVLGTHVTVQLRLLLIAIYGLLLVCCAWGIARQARARDRRLLVSIAAPWALMFFILGQMDERYLVWSACFTAGAVAVGWWAIGAHVMLSWAGAATMLEFLLICQPAVAPGLLHVLILLNPLTWIVTALAVAMLLFGSMRIKRETSDNSSASPAATEEARPLLAIAA